MTSIEVASTCPTNYFRDLGPVRRLVTAFYKNQVRDAHRLLRGDVERDGVRFRKRAIGHGIALLHLDIARNGTGHESGRDYGGELSAAYESRGQFMLAKVIEYEYDP